MKNKVKWAIIGLVVLAFAIGSVISMMMPVPVRMTAVTAQTATLTFTEQGVVTAENTVLVFPATQGELNGIYVREGQRVCIGDALLSVDSTALYLQLEQVQSGIRSLEAQLANADLQSAMICQDLISARNSLQGELQRIDAQAFEATRVAANALDVIHEQIGIQQLLIEQYQHGLNRANIHLSNVNILYQSGAMPRAELDSAQDAVTAAQTALDTAQRQLSVIAAAAPQDSAEIFAGMRTSISAQIAGINQRLAQDTTAAARANFEALIAIEQVRITQIEREIANTTVTAPISGIVTTLHAQNSNFVSTAAPIAEITEPGTMSIAVYVSVQDIGSISVGDTVGLTLRQRLEDVEFKGRVAGIGSTAVVRHTALGVEQRKISVQIAPQIPADVHIGIGHALDVTFDVFREENMIVIPRTAVFQIDGQDMVWVVRGAHEGRAGAAPVETGMTLRMNVIILSGLYEGDFVINNANNADIAHGTRVTNEQ